MASPARYGLRLCRSQVILARAATFAVQSFSKGKISASSSRSLGSRQADWTLAELDSWRLHGLYRDPSDPRRGLVQLYFDADGKQARMVHSEYGPVPADLKIVAKGEGNWELKAGSKSLQLLEGGLLFDDGTLASSVAAREGQPPNADAYINAVSILERFCFTKAECDRVINSNKLRKWAWEQGQVPAPRFECNDAVPSDWADVPTHKRLWVKSWHRQFGWSRFQVEAAFHAWQSHSGSQPIPSVQDLRAYGYCLKFFGRCVQDATERDRLVAILRQPDTALAQYLVLHHKFWQLDENVNRIDEIQEHFEGMTRDDFQRQVRPAALLAQLERNRSAHASSDQCADRFPCLKLVEPYVHQRGDLKVELITTPDELVQESRLLKNCGASYRQKAAEGKCVLLVLKQAEKSVAMAEWCPFERRFVQMVESCNKRIRPEWKEIFDEGQKLLPKRFVIKSGGRALMNMIYLSHEACEALGQTTELNVGDVDISLSLDSILRLTEADLSSLPHSLTELISLVDTMRRYPTATFEEAESLADVAILNYDMEFAKRLCNIGASHCLLLRACQMACPLEIIGALTKIGAGLNEQCPKGLTPLHFAAHNGLPELAQLLIGAKADLNAQTRNGCTPLHLALQNGQTELVQLLIRAKADVNLKDSWGRTALHVAVERGLAELAQLLIRAKADLNAQTRSGCTPLHLALQNGQTELVQLLIRAKADLNLKDSRGCTALHVAVERGLAELAQLLIRAKADLNAQARSGCTPLHLALQNGQTELVQLLIRAKVDLNLKDSNGRAALHVAVDSGLAELVQLLIGAKADLNAQSGNGCTSLHLALLNGQTELVQLLIRAKADLNLKDSNDRTALHLAFQNGQTELVPLLIRAKADLNLKDSWGRTALHLALLNGQTELVKLLIRAKADVNLKDSWGRTALHVAVERGLAELVQLLIGAKADLNAQARNGCTPLHLALQNGQTELVQLLIRAKADWKPLHREISS